MSGECFEHDLQWYSGGIECPLCTLTSERDRLWEALTDAIDLIDRHHEVGYEEKYVLKGDCLLCQNKKIWRHLVTSLPAPR